jgi:hypothetical protein
MMLHEFISNAIIGPIHLGMSKRAVQSVLGVPQETSDRQKGRELWKYDDLQLGFHQGVVYFIGVYITGYSVKLPLPLIFDELLLAKVMRLEDMENFLLANKIAFEVDEKLTFDDQVCLRIVESKVGIYFGVKLWSIQVQEQSN